MHMSRARNLPIEEVRAQALEAFWRFGFEATSLSVLEDFTKTGRRSLLNTFGDKQSLFRAVLEIFASRLEHDIYLRWNVKALGWPGLKRRWIVFAKTPVLRVVERLPRMQYSA